jgi:hypothetical protein
VSTDALDETGFQVPDRYIAAEPDGGSSWQRGRGIARGVYQTLLGLGLKYMDEPWRRESFAYEATPRQRVRYPAWMRRDSGGTCLDLAILYATALLKAQIRPYIAIQYHTRFTTSDEGSPEGHAFVVADLRAPAGDHRWEPSPRYPMERPPGEPAQEGALLLPAAPEWAPYLLAVDPMYATINFPLAEGKTSEAARDFAEAEAAGREYLSAGETQLCDVMTALAGEFQALPRPAEKAIPAIWTRLPEMPPVTRYPSRAPVHQRLAAARGRIVIHGDQGLGKSTLAYIRAREADGGYGWFLNAADQSTLQSQLALAENEQRARGYKEPVERRDQQPFSDLAVRRLEESDAPWVLVLDNANGNPGDITPLLPRAIGPDQTIIVTTTNAEWLKEWPEPQAAHVALRELSSADMSGIDKGLRELVGGSPLFYEATRAAIHSGARVPAVPESMAGLVWQLAQDCLAEHSAAMDLAHLVAWAPPVALPTASFAQFFEHDGKPDGDPDRLARLLEQAGLVRLLTRQAPSVLMHRLIATRIRGDERLIQLPGHQPVPAPVAFLAARAGQDLMTRLGDEESFTRLEDWADRDRPAKVPVRTWGHAVYGIARAGEIRGRSARSSHLFEKAIGYLDPGLDRSLLSESWNGRARYLKDNPPRDRDERTIALSEALSWAVKAQELAVESASEAPAGSDQRLWDHVRAERARAMQALIMRKQAANIADASVKKARLTEAQAILKDSEAQRLDHLKALGILDSPDMDRARFNLGGGGIDLAKLSQGAEAEGHVRDARNAYEEAKHIRVSRFGEGFVMPAIAACDFGIALAYYYGALLKADPLRDEREAYRPISPQSRMFLLRQASTACVESLRDRSLLAPPDRDDDDATKSDNLIIKISEMRKLVSTFHARNGKPLSLAEAKGMLGKAETTEVLKEARDLGGLIESTPEAKAGQAS